MNARDKPHGSQDLLDTLSPELGYVWSEPSPPYPLSERPFWMDHDRNARDVRDAQDTKEALIEELIEEAWKVAFLRQQIEAIGLRPKGRTRAGLVRQLVEGFLDRERLRQAFTQLTSEERRYYLCLLLKTQILGLNIHMPDMGSICETERTSGALMHRILMMGLGMQTPDGDFFVPYHMLRHLPQTALTFPEADEPERYAEAPSHHRLMLRVQQLVTLIQSREDSLCPLPRWQLSNFSYGGSIHYWPPTPESAEAIIAQSHGQTIEMLPLPPFLAEETLDVWTRALDLSVPEVEFLYHLLTASGLLHAGSPVQPEPELFERWLATPPVRQFSILYKTFLSLGQWAAWTPQWRERKVRVSWQAYQVWSMIRFDQELYTARYTFRWALMDVLSFLPQETWLDLDAIEDWLVELFPRPEGHTYLYSLHLEAVPGGWKAFLRLALTSLVSGPLYSFGLVDLAPSRDNVSQIRMHQLQDVHWQRTEALSLESVDALSPAGIHLSAEEQLLSVKTPAPPDFLTFVQRWAEPAGLNADEFRYRLDASRLHRAFEQGEMPEILTRRWKEHVGFLPPESLRAWWQRWWDRYGHVRLYRDQAVLMTQDEFTMQELRMALPKLEDAIRGWASSQAALLNPERVDEILADMERQGYMPKEDTPDGRS